MTKVHHAHLYGTCDDKYDWLRSHNILSTDWQNIQPKAPLYLLIPQNTNFLDEYERGWKITDVMSLNSTGVKTHRDHFVINFDAERLKKSITQFCNLQISDDVVANQYSLSDTPNWKLNSRRRSLAADKNWEHYLTKCLYRPFDLRAYFHHQDVVDRPRHEVMKHFVEGRNLGLITTRQTRDKWSVLVTSFPCVHKSCAAYDTNSVFPLYLYPDRNSLTQERLSNFSPEFLEDIAAELTYLPTSEAIFFYIYAVFHSHTYRSRYAEFLKIDFPRVPLTSDSKLFQQLATYGEELVDLHLMKSPKLDNFITDFEENSNCIVDPGHPKYGDDKVVINKRGDAFTRVPEEVWDFYIGGYKVCQKWLKDRKGRTLSPEDITHYQRIIVALQETIRLMQQIDEAIPSWPIE